MQCAWAIFSSTACPAVQYFSSLSHKRHDFQVKKFLNYLSVLQASTCHTDTTPTSHTETPTHIETRTHDQCGDIIEKSQAPDDGCINARNMLSIEEVK